MKRKSGRATNIELFGELCDKYFAKASVVTLCSYKDILARRKSEGDHEAGLLLNCYDTVKKFETKEQLLKAALG